tara:strand:- start:978 stop:1163 length:186 start_codon:yes stop_codon:yes gene_type:complete
MANKIKPKTLLKDRKNAGKSTDSVLNSFKWGMKRVLNMYEEHGYLTPKAMAIINKWKKKGK